MPNAKLSNGNGMQTKLFSFFPFRPLPLLPSFDVGQPSAAPAALPAPTLPDLSMALVPIGGQLAKACPAQSFFRLFFHRFSWCPAILQSLFPAFCWMLPLRLVQLVDCRRGPGGLLMCGKRHPKPVPCSKMHGRCTWVTHFHTRSIGQWRFSITISSFCHLCQPGMGVGDGPGGTAGILTLQGEIEDDKTIYNCNYCFLFCSTLKQLAGYLWELRVHLALWTPTRLALAMPSLSLPT